MRRPWPALSSSTTGKKKLYSEAYDQTGAYSKVTDFITVHYKFLENPHFNLTYSVTVP